MLGADLEVDGLLALALERGSAIGELFSPVAQARLELRVARDGDEFVVSVREALPQRRNSSNPRSESTFHKVRAESMSPRPVEERFSTSRTAPRRSGDSRGSVSACDRERAKSSCRSTRPRAGTRFIPFLDRNSPLLP